MSEQIIVSISADGASHAETKGMKGDKCLASIEVLEELLDARVLSSNFTDEYTQTGTVTTNEIDDELSQH